MFKLSAPWWTSRKPWPASQEWTPRLPQIYWWVDESPETSNLIWCLYLSTVSFVCRYRAWMRLKKAQSQNLNTRKIIFSLVSRNLVSFWSKFIHSGWKSLRLTNQYDVRLFSTFCFWDFFDFDIVKAKKYCLSII